MTQPRVECVLNAGATVGEGAIWSVTQQRLLWVDIPAGALHFFDPATGADTVTDLGRPVGCVAETARCTVIAALTDGFFEVDPHTGDARHLAGPAPQDKGHRFNDGTTDARGRFIAGTMPLGGASVDDTRGTVHVYADGWSRQILDGFNVINGMAFSPDGRTFYASDSFPTIRTIWAWDYDLDDGEISGRRVFLDTSALAGRPDGGAMDADGCYWMAGVGGWQIYRLTPEGRVDMTIDMPVEKPTRIAFGGRNLSTLFVTSIRAEDDPTQPLSGGLFALRVPGVTGLPMPLVP